MYLNFIALNKLTGSIYISNTKQFIFSLAGYPTLFRTVHLHHSLALLGPSFIYMLPNTQVRHASSRPTRQPVSDQKRHVESSHSQHSSLIR